MEQKKFWKGFDELLETPEFIQNKQNEFGSELPIVNEVKNVVSEKQATRRDFLKMLGFSVGAATIAASCEIPIKKAIPYVNKPEEILPGMPTFYASSFVDGSDYCSVLVKTREGRPIKIEGNDLSGITQGGTSARAQASVVSLYDGNRLKAPYSGDTPTDWAKIDAEISRKLGSASGTIALLTGSIISPSTKKAIDAFKGRYANTKHVVYEAISNAGMLIANQRSHGKKAIPSYDFSKADTIVGIDCDFLGTWISPTEFTKQYIKNRKVDPKKPKMSKHFQFESRVTLAGSKADHRFSIKPSQIGQAAVDLYNALKSGTASKIADPKVKQGIKDAATALKKSNGKALVVCGSNDPNVQEVVNAINQMLGSYGSTIDMNKPYNVHQGDDKAMNDLVNDMNSGRVGAVILWGVNPAYNYPDADKFKSALGKVGLSISFNSHKDETSAAGVKYLCPDNHYLESWNDAEPKKGCYSLSQPTIAPLFNTRSGQESLLKWAGNNTTYYDFIKKNWQQSIYTQGGKGSFKAFWDTVLHDGVFEVGGNKSAVSEVMSMYGVASTSAKPVVHNAAAHEEATKEAASHAEGDHDHAHDGAHGQEEGHAEEPAATQETNNSSALSGGGNVSGAISAIQAASKGGIQELAIYENVLMGDGRYAINPFLQETPEPISKICWDNVIHVSPKYAKEKGWNEYDILEVTDGTTTVQLPMIYQPGQLHGTFSIALGYGRTNTGNEHCNTGVNMFPFVKVDPKTGTFNYTVTNGLDVKRVRAAAQYEVACTQTHNNVDDGGLGDKNYRRKELLVREAALDKYKKNHWRGNQVTQAFENDKDHLHFTLYGPDDDYGDHAKATKQGHHWGLAVDLNSCIGCGACVVACNIENNVPIVGKHEVARAHEMHWMRVDRYYSALTSKDANGDPLDPAYWDQMEHPDVTFMPMMCQHCDNAPCENVCPVAATSHSSEGLNQMAYNRCIGTRYCANNCPFKVRRFNWFDYQGADSFYKNTIFDNDEYVVMEDLTRMVLNPDVTVRSRGVMEKCSFCVQRLQAGKLEAKKDGRPLKDGEIKTACQQSCPANALVFGDMNDKNSEVSKMMANERSYHLLEEIHVVPSVSYMTNIRNRDTWLAYNEGHEYLSEKGHGHGGHDDHGHGKGHDNHGKGHDDHGKGH